MRTQRETCTGRRPVATNLPATRTVLAVVLALGGLAACGNDPAGPATDPAAAEERQQLREEIAALQDRIDALEEQSRPDGGPGDDAPADGDPQSGEQGTAGGGASGRASADPVGVFTDPEPLVGQDVTVTAEVSGLISVTQVGAAFRLADGEGNTIGVIMVTPPADLEVGDVMRVTGPLARVEQDGFEADFGIAADALVDDPEAFFDDVAGEFAIAARDVEVLQQPSG
ncbi:hypothetical protein [Blastococcus sp. VKM Ac-2987]|uniref:hypothetical protein n=1 Tax=Blastococcus sp. VKM Ac-2987 TaxID=3004141 RepID=UPI0022AB8A13|nr:hypothetical protein [Blastococcus sp. VKM Ac-2987]MCZ2857310.1 hypothetical protein [Blastococcus sp. VKM Ac-2987]